MSKDRLEICFCSSFCCCSAGKYSDHRFIREMPDTKEILNQDQAGKNLISRIERGLVRIYNSKSFRFVNAESGRLLKSIIEWREKLKTK